MPKEAGVGKECAIARGIGGSRHALDHSEPIADWKGNKQRIPYCHRREPCLLTSQEESFRGTRQPISDEARSRSLAQPITAWMHPYQSGPPCQFASMCLSCSVAVFNVSSTRTEQVDRTSINVQENTPAFDAWSNFGKPWETEFRILNRGYCDQTSYTSVVCGVRRTSGDGEPRAAAVRLRLASAGDVGHEAAEAAAHWPLPHHAQEATQETDDAQPHAGARAARRHTPRPSAGNTTPRRLSLRLRRSQSQPKSTTVVVTTITTCGDDDCCNSDDCSHDDDYCDDDDCCDDDDYCDYCDDDCYDHHREYGAAPEWMDGVKREILEKTLRPAASSGTITMRENPGATPPGIEPGSPWWDASSLTITPPRLLTVNRALLNSIFEQFHCPYRQYIFTLIDIRLVKLVTEGINWAPVHNVFLVVVTPLESRRATSCGYNSSHPVWHALYECLQDIHGDSSPFLLQTFHELSNGFWPRLTIPHPAIQFVPKMFYRVEVGALGGPVQSANIVVGAPLHMNMEQRRNEGAGKTEDPRENPPTNGMNPTCENSVTRPGIEHGSPWWEASRLSAQPPWARIE
ncbi:hypothetical protein PR048_002591 [Dryococelus australis]|uniref:Uncharacterized protein n=1 Tax=Dryococelus australis TaxID=614101 RepID=A0ABQ9IKJ8_9NEOP|nr:hypothetical protein PR048_002591 [Dryococelus australis]